MVLMLTPRLVIQAARVWPLSRSGRAHADPAPRRGGKEPPAGTAPIAPTTRGAGALRGGGGDPHPRVGGGVRGTRRGSGGTDDAPPAPQPRRPPPRHDRRIASRRR